MSTLANTPETESTHTGLNAEGELISAVFCTECQQLNDIDAEACIHCGHPIEHDYVPLHRLLHRISAANGHQEASPGESSPAPISTSGTSALSAVGPISEERAVSEIHESGLPRLAVSLDWLLIGLGTMMWIILIILIVWSAQR